jgi:hypothetical protein
VGRGQRGHGEQRADSNDGDSAGIGHGPRSAMGMPRKFPFIDAARDPPPLRRA